MLLRSASTVYDACELVEERERTQEKAHVKRRVLTPQKDTVTGPLSLRSLASELLFICRDPGPLTDKVYWLCVRGGGQHNQPSGVGNTISVSQVKHL